MNNLLPGATRSWLVFTHDAAAALVAWYAAYWLRFNLSLPAEYLPSIQATAVWVIPLQALIFLGFGLYRGLWRFASLPDLKRIFQAVAAAALAVPVVLILFRVQAIVPRAVLLLDALLLLLFLGGSRFLYRAWRERNFSLPIATARPTLVLGAGAAADHLLREFSRASPELRIIGLLDDNPALLARRLRDVSVLGRLQDLPRHVRELGVKDAILAIPSAPSALRQQLLDQCAALGVDLLTVPSLNDIVQGRVSIAALRKIELNDLLGRPPVALDDSGLLDYLVGRVVLVTGAGGSIGSELCRQLARYRPARLVLFELNEFALYALEQEFLKDFPDVPLTSLIGDVKDRARVDQALREHRPTLVFHAAAYKHVPLMEQDNALQALRNNVLGTWVMAKAARAAGVEKFVLISTDKAVNPTNVMGASKRLAEMLCQALQENTLPDAGRTCFFSVRFGNVLGSSGSVIPKFQQQIEAGGPITVTHPEITRYFMSIPEAAQLVLQAALMGQGGEIFVLDMGEQVRIVDLARLMIRLAGKSEEEIRIEFTGLRPGEKLYEELLVDAETTQQTPHPKLRMALARGVDCDGVATLLDWLMRAEAVEPGELRRWIALLVPEYRPALVGGATSVNAPSR